MKKFCRNVLIVILLVVGSVALNSADAKNAPTVIVTNGISDFRIVIPDNAEPVISYAAKELQYFLKEISGAQLPIVAMGQAPCGPAFCIGLKQQADPAALEQLGKLNEDGVLIRTAGDNILLLGKDSRGQLYSVYVFLEKFLGVRFLTGDCTVIPKRDVLTLPEIDYSYSPPFMYRETLYFDSFPREIATRQRLNGPYTECDTQVGGRWIIHPFVHSFSRLVPADKYFDKHPEYFSLIAGIRKPDAVDSQLCLTNPDVLKIATEQVLQWCQQYPEVPVFDVSQNDGNGWCECEKCTAVVEQEGSRHGPILRFVNAIADEVAKKYPDRWIETLAYAYSVHPPAITKPRDNVIIRLCHTGDYFTGFEHNDLGSNLVENIKSWRKSTRRIFIWHYAVNFHHYPAPNQNLNGLARDIRAYAKYGANGVMIQGDYQSPCGELAELRQYLSAQLMWDPTQDPMTIRREFCQGYYGLAAADVLEYLALLDKYSDDPDSKLVAFCAWDPSKTVPVEMVTDGLKILTAAREKSDSPEIANRIDKLLIPLWYMQLTYPNMYHLASENAMSVISRFEAVAKANNMTHISETCSSDASSQNSSGDVDIWQIRKVFLKDANLDAWLKSTKARHQGLADNVVCDLYCDLDKAKSENCLDVKLSSVHVDDLLTIFHHPPGKGHGDINYNIALPGLRNVILEGVENTEKLILRFGIVISGLTGDGVRFSILIDDKEIWTRTHTNMDIVYQDIDLSKWAGKKIRLTLRVDGLDNNLNDWANWIRPTILLEK
jgi:hypothetical protein